MALLWLASEQMIIAANASLPAAVILQTSEQLQVLSRPPPHQTLRGQTLSGIKRKPSTFLC